jgi:hypothetical protein
MTEYVTGFSGDLFVLLARLPDGYMVVRDPQTENVLTLPSYFFVQR